MKELKEKGEVFFKVVDYLPKKWTPPEKKILKCEYCGAEMIAIKKNYKAFVCVGKLEDRYSYEYECPNKCKEKLEQKRIYAERYKKAKEIWDKVGFSRECIGWNLNKMTCENIEYLKQYVKDFNRFSKGLVFKGYKGTGKSLSSECIAKELTKRNFKVKITNMTEINIGMNSALFKDNYDGYLKELMSFDLLIIDDFGREQYNTEKSLENVFQFFNTITKEHKPFIVSINPEMLAIISQKPQLDACLDRFKKSSRVKILKFTQKSFRK